MTERTDRELLEELIDAAKLAVELYAHDCDMDDAIQRLENAALMAEGGAA